MRKGGGGREVTRPPPESGDGRDRRLRLLAGDEGARKAKSSEEF
jgi:hypothetical protein